MKIKLNKIKHTLLYGAAITFLLTGYSCTEEDVYSDSVSSSQKLELGAAYPLTSRATDAGFTDHDYMGVYVVDYDQDKPGTLSPTTNRATNVRFTFHEADNRWVGATDIFWKDSKTPVDIYGYYPFIPNLKEITDYPFMLQSKQNVQGIGVELGGYEASDLLWAKAEKIAPTKQVISLMYNHIMAGVKVKLEKGTGFADEEWNTLDKKVLITNTILNATVDFSKGKVTVGKDKPMLIYPYEYNHIHAAVVVPQTIAQGTEFINITVGTKAFSFKKPQDFTFTSGKMHFFTITVSKKNATGDYEFKVGSESIKPWVDDPDFHDGILREYVTVHVDKVGTLEKVLQKMGKDYKSIFNLKVTGYLGWQDFTFMRDKMDMLTNLNIKEAIMADDNGKPNYCLPGGAFNQKTMLTHVILPDSLVDIGNNAFEKTNLMGNVIIPEGVVRIGALAFCDCKNLKGELKLPSTLKKVETCAFQYTGLNCELRLPSGLEYIGGAAFGSHFKGKLILPESLTDLGGGAFSGCHFTGDIIIPQGLKIIEPGALSGIGEGNLEIPEGILEIREEAFLGSHIRGEVKLPESLRWMGKRAFEGTQISSIVFPKNLNYVGMQAFKNCRHLQGVVNWPESATLIGKETFQGCSLLEGIVIPETVTQIGKDAFDGCNLLNSIVCKAEEPPLAHPLAFRNIARDNFSIEVPAKSIDAYRQANTWKEFKRFTEYSNFVCRPQHACAINTVHNETLVLNADGDWKVTHMPSWCKLSQTSGKGKTSLTLTISEMAQGSPKRVDYIEFELVESGYHTKCEVEQHNYKYAEDACIELQKATKGTGDNLNILFVGDGFDAASLASGKYLDIVEQQVASFFAIEPYKTYREYFNVKACIALSQESGVNTLNTYRNTRFETIYGGCTDKLIPDDKLIFNYIDNYAADIAKKLDKGLVILVPNSSAYGGNTYFYDNGMTISICSPHEDPYEMRAIVQHEAGGHGFGKLGDETVEKNLFAPFMVKASVNEFHQRGWYMNLSTSSRMNEVPWSDFIFDKRYSNNVDIFEGGMGYTRGIFRSEINSCMNYGIPYYNAISRLEIVKRILNFSGEGFTLDKFLATDTQAWGPEVVTRAVPPAARPVHMMSGHVAPKFIKRH